MLVRPYLSFEGRCVEAIEFYKQAIGAEVPALVRFKDSPDQSMVSPGSEEKVLHSEIKIGDSVIMATDGCDCGTAEFKGISLTLEVDTEAEVERFFSALSDGGEVKMPLTPTFFSPKFGMLTDRFGVDWLLLVSKK